VEEATTVPTYHRATKPFYSAEYPRKAPKNLDKIGSIYEFLNVLQASLPGRKT
jgi:hypothetical protein